MRMFSEVSRPGRRAARAPARSRAEAARGPRRRHGLLPCRRVGVGVGVERRACACSTVGAALQEPRPTVAFEPRRPSQSPSAVGALRAQRAGNDRRRLSRAMVQAGRGEEGLASALKQIKDDLYEQWQVVQETIKTANRGRTSAQSRRVTPTYDEALRALAASATAGDATWGEDLDNVKRIGMRLWAELDAALQKDGQRRARRDRLRAQLVVASLRDRPANRRRAGHGRRREAADAGAAAKLHDRRAQGLPQAVRRGQAGQGRVLTKAPRPSLHARRLQARDDELGQGAAVDSPRGERGACSSRRRSTPRLRSKPTRRVPRRRRATPLASSAVPRGRRSSLHRRLFRSPSPFFSLLLALVLVPLFGLPPETLSSSLGRGAASSPSNSLRGPLPRLFAAAVAIGIGALLVNDASASTFCSTPPSLLPPFSRRLVRKVVLLREALLPLGEHLARKRSGACCRHRELGAGAVQPPPT